MRSVLHIIPSLGQGGAEKILSQITQEIDANHTIVYFFNEPVFFNFPPEVELICLHLEKGKFSFLNWLQSAKKLFSIFAIKKNSVVMGWLYYGAIAACFAKFYKNKIIWSIHCTKMPMRQNFLVWLTCRVLACLSFWPDIIQMNSIISRKQHVAMGFRNDILIIPNGIDFAYFANPDVAFVAKLRQQFCGTGGGGKIIFAPGRYSPQKDFENLITAASLLKRAGFNFSVVMAGRGCDENNSELRDLLVSLDMHKNFILLGSRNDMREIYHASDLTVSCSAYGETMTLTVLEAIACGKPVVMTDVGDLPLYLKQKVPIVPPGQPEKLMTAIITSLSDTCDITQAHTVVRDNLSLEKMIMGYRDMIFSCLK